MLRSAMLAIGAVAAFSLPAHAEYYTVHGPDRHCRAVEHYTPGEHELVRTGLLSFGDREEAKQQVKVLCQDNGYYSGEERRGVRW